MNIDDVLAKLSPDLRKKIGTADSLSRPAIAETKSIGLNRALGGGFRYGRQHLVYGNKSAGKSSMIMELVGIEQAKGKTALWIDVEQTFDADWAERLGVDSKSLVVSNARSVNDMVDVGQKFMSAGIDIIVVDSISTLLPAIFFDKSSELKDLIDTKQIGAEARDMAHAVKMLNYANNQNGETLLILISQTRNNIGAMYASIVPTGGKAVQFYSSTIVQLFSSESDNQAIKGSIYVGDKILEEKIGRKVLWDVKFSKTSPSFQRGEYDFYFRGDFVGIDSVADIFDTAEYLGIIERGGAWYRIGDQKFMGRETAIKEVKKSKELQAMLIGNINEI